MAATAIRPLIVNSTRREGLGGFSLPHGTSAATKNLISALVQASGVSALIPCQRCAQGHGLWTGCVVVPRSVVDSTPLCANCYYGGGTDRCSWDPQVRDDPQGPQVLHVTVAQAEALGPLEEGQPSSEAQPLAGQALVEHLCRQAEALSDGDCGRLVQALARKVKPTGEEEGDHTAVEREEQQQQEEEEQQEEEQQEEDVAMPDVGCDLFMGDEEGQGEEGEPSGAHAPVVRTPEPPAREEEAHLDDAPVRDPADVGLEVASLRPASLEEATPQPSDDESWLCDQDDKFAGSSIFASSPALVLTHGPGPLPPFEVSPMRPRRRPGQTSLASQMRKE